MPRSISIKGITIQRKRLVPPEIKYAGYITKEELEEHRELERKEFELREQLIPILIQRRMLRNNLCARIKYAKIAKKKKYNVKRQGITEVK